MSLNYDLSRIANYRTTCYQGDGDDRKLAPTTHLLIFATMAIGLGEISNDNLDEWRFRLTFLDMTGRGVPEIHEEDLLEHLGLSTNVHDETRAAWRKRIVKNLELDAEYAARDGLPHRAPKGWEAAQTGTEG